MDPARGWEGLAARTPGHIFRHRGVDAKASKAKRVLRVLTFSRVARGGARYSRGSFPDARTLESRAKATRTSERSPLLTDAFSEPTRQPYRSPRRYFLSRLKKVKKANGQIIACNEIFEEDVTSIKNYGVWIRYQSRTGFHNAYKEYREVSMNKAVDALYEEMASRHRVRAPCLQIIKIAQVADDDVKRDNTIQFLGRKEPVSFPVVNKVLRPDAKSQKTTFKYSRPNFSAL